MIIKYILLCIQYGLLFDSISVDPASEQLESDFQHGVG